jgi:hypothetical protein
MKKQEIIEAIQEFINGGSITSDIWKKAHPLVVEKYASMAFNSMFYNLFRKDFSNFELYSKWFFNQDVKRDSQKTYSIIPIQVVQVPTKGDSVRDITAAEDRFSVRFAPTTFIEYKRLHNLGTAGRNRIVGYNVNSDIIEYYGMPNDVCNVNLYLLRSFEDFGRFESVPIPLGKDQEFMGMIIQYFNTKSPDLNNNNNPI